MAVIVGQGISVSPVADAELSHESTSTVQNKVVTDAIASEYSTSKTYNVGDVCTHDGKLYECIVDIPTAEGWTLSHWKVSNLGDNVSNLNRKINDGTLTFTKQFMSDNRYSTNRIYNAYDSNIGKKLSDIYSAQTVNSFAYMVDVTLSKKVSFPTGAATSTSSYGYLAFDENDICVWTRPYTAGDTAGGIVEVVLPENAVKFLFVAGNSLNNLGTDYEVTVDKKNAIYTIGENEKVANYLSKDIVKVIDGSDFTYGSINASTGVPDTSVISIHTDFIPIDEATKVVWSPASANAVLGKTLVYFAMYYDFDKKFVLNKGISAQTVAGEYSVGEAGYIKIVIRTSDYTQIAQDNFDIVAGAVAIKTNRSELALPAYEMVNRFSEQIDENASDIVRLTNSAGGVYRKSFTVAANASHSSLNDQILVSIPANTQFYLFLSASELAISSLAMVYAFQNDGTQISLLNTYPGQQANKVFPRKVNYGIAKIGVFYRNDASSAATVKFVVAVDELEFEELYNGTRDSLLVDALASTANKEILGRYANTTDGEIFTFYSDPHYLMNNGEMTKDNISRNLNEYLHELDVQSKAVDAKIVICGGDLINAEPTDEVLCYKLAMHNSMVRKLFGDRYHLALGNHDSRFDATDQNIIDNMLYSEENTQKAYFSVKTPKTRFYFLNTGTDQNGAMNAYRWEQLDWFADELNSDKEANRILVMHIFSTASSASDFGNAITPMATNALSIIAAFNSKGSVTLNDETYNFANAVGKVRCILCGHTHYDTIYTATGDIPVLCIDDATAIGASASMYFDTCFADYDNGKMYAYRIGSSEPREITLA